MVRVGTRGRPRGPEDYQFCSHPCSHPGPTDRCACHLGEEKPRQILAGLAEYYEPEKLLGRKVVVVANLKPRKMRGLESQGMICAASLTDADSPAVATFIEDVKVGSRLK